MHRVPASAVVTAVLFTFLAGAGLPSADADEVRRTGLQFAAVQGLTYSDRGSHVLFQRGTLRVRVYPDTAMVIVAGRQHQVKDRFVREAGDVLLTPRVQRFVARQIRAYEADMSARLAAARRRRSVALQPLPPVPVRAKRRSVPIRKPATKASARVMRTATPAAARPAVRGDASWVPATKERAWKWIVLHHSDDTSGNMAKYDDVHRNTNKWENGCGYHFVIGNGSKSGDGEIEVGPRWPVQLQGAHAKVPGNCYNERGVGICLVGDFESGAGPSRAQKDALVRLVRWLKQRYRIRDADIHGHCDCCATACPGKNFPMDEIRRRVR